MSVTDPFQLASAVQSDAGGAYHFTAVRELCLGPPSGKHLSGGAAMAAAISALEIETGKPLICASGQFVGSPAAGAQVDIAISIAKAGRSITHARAETSSNEVSLLNLQASVGARSGDADHTWSSRPDAPPPSSCEKLRFIRMDENDQHSHMDFRHVSKSGGTMTFWAKAPQDRAIRSSDLALVADYLPEAVHGALGVPAGAVSLDNELRIIKRERSDWLLCVTELSTVANGLFHGRMDVFSEAGSLVGLASQSGVVRLFK